MRLLLTGDLHIGRTSSRIRRDGVRTECLRAATAWQRIVDLAMEQRVAAVLLSGDVADENNKFWEAIGPLEGGIRRLVQAGIRTVAVAGNHDYDVLSRLADQFAPEHFKLLGRAGAWERMTLDDGASTLYLDGWSFPRQRVHESPLASYDLSRDPLVPILGMLHGDLDSATTPYAPLDLTQLQGLPPTGWLLGHVHAPRLVAGRAWVLYAGSPQALDPGETGPHGPWLVEVQSGTVGRPRQEPLSTVWYDRCVIDVSRARTEGDLETTIWEAIRAEGCRIVQAAGPHLACVSLRVRLEGVTPMAHHVAGMKQRLLDDLSVPIGQAVLVVEAVEDAVVPDIDLAQFAAAKSAPGAVARLLLELNADTPSQEVARLIRDAQIALQQSDRQRDFALLERRGITEETARDQLRRACNRLLIQLVQQAP